MLTYLYTVILPVPEHLGHCLNEKHFDSTYGMSPDPLHSGHRLDDFRFFIFIYPSIYKNNTTKNNWIFTITKSKTYVINMIMNVCKFYHLNISFAIATASDINPSASKILIIIILLNMQIKIICLYKQF